MWCSWGAWWSRSSRASDGPGLRSGLLNRLGGMATRKNQNWTGFSVHKYQEGGYSKADLTRMMGELGLKCRFGYSIYVGQILMEVNTADQRKLERVEKALWG